MAKVLSVLATLTVIVGAVFASVTHFATAQEVAELRQYTSMSIELLEIQRLQDRLSELLAIPEEKRTPEQIQMILFYEAEIEKRKERIGGMS